MEATNTEVVLTTFNGNNRDFFLSGLSVHPIEGRRWHFLSSVQFSRSVVSNSLWLRELQHSRPPCPSPTPGVYLNSCPLSQWCHPAISSSIVPISTYPQSFKWVCSLHQVAKILEFQLDISLSNEHPGLIFFRMGWLDLLAVCGTLQSLLQHHSSKASILQHSPFFTVQLYSIY